MRGRFAKIKVSSAYDASVNKDAVMFIVVLRAPPPAAFGGVAALSQNIFRRLVCLVRSTFDSTAFSPHFLYHASFKERNSERGQKTSEISNCS